MMGIGIIPIQSDGKLTDKNIKKVADAVPSHEKASNSSERFPEIGDVVIHNKFGSGTIIRIRNRKTKIDVQFSDGIKTFVYPYAFEKGFLYFKE